VRKWRKRLLVAGMEDYNALRSRSRVPHHLPERIHSKVIECILEIRDHPPENLQRTPGPRTILYYLRRDESLKASGLYLPRSPSTVWAILDQHQRILRKPKVEHCPVERPEPMAAWQMDFKDISSVLPEENGKRLHVVEAFNILDIGSSFGARIRTPDSLPRVGNSLLLESLPASDYTAETTLWLWPPRWSCMACQTRFDRGPRFVGS
jgi:hypothetical protein